MGRSIEDWTFIYTSMPAGTGFAGRGPCTRLLAALDGHGDLVHQEVGAPQEAPERLPVVFFRQKVVQSEMAAYRAFCARILLLADRGEEG